MVITLIWYVRYAVALKALVAQCRGIRLRSVVVSVRSRSGAQIVKSFGVKWGDDISSEMEQKIVLHYGVPVFVTHYPKELKPFYMKKGEFVADCFDLIFPVVGEIIGGSQREEDYQTLKTEMERSELDIDKMQWYLDTRKWGSVPHSGFGLGFERLLMFITGATKIHDVIPFPVSY